MCERSPLLLFEAKSILFELLNRTLELFDLSLHFLEHYRLTQFLSEREHQRDYRYFSLLRPCRLNYNISSDIDTYLRALHTSCRLIKSHLRSLHAARLASAKDYIVIDDEIYDLIKFFKSKLIKIQSIHVDGEPRIQNTQKRRYHSQRLTHSLSTNRSFVFHPQASSQSNNSESTSIPSTEPVESQQILLLFKKISRFYHVLLDKFYGVHTVRDSDILQPIAISIIRLLLSITAKLREKLQMVSPTKVHHNRFRVEPHDEVCREQETTVSSKPTFQLIEIPPQCVETAMVPDDDTSIDYARNVNHSTQRKEDEQTLWEFDEDEFNRLANLDQDE